MIDHVGGIPQILDYCQSMGWVVPKIYKRSVDPEIQPGFLEIADDQTFSVEGNNSF